MTAETSKTDVPVVDAEEIRDRITSALVHLAQLDAQRIRVLVSDRTAWLTGSVSSVEARHRAGHVAQSAPGIDDVRNNIEVR